MAFRAVVGNAWENITDARVVVSGLTRRPLSMRAVVGGVWKNVWDHDKTGPGPVTGLTAQWDNSAASNKAIVSWTQPADVDFSYTYVEVNRTGSSAGPWTTVGNFTAARATATSYTDTAVSFFSYPSHNAANTATYIHYYRLTPYDALGNPGTASIVGTTGQNSTVVRGMLSSPFWVNPNSSKTWRGNSWRSDSFVTDTAGTTERVIQGWTTSGENFGHFWYDTKQTGINPTASYVWLQRTTNQGQGQSQPYIRLSQAPSTLVPSGSSPTGYARTAATIPPEILTTQPLAQCQIDVTWITHLMDGATWKSLLMYTGETSQYLTSGISRQYLAFYSRNEGGFGIVGGTLQINHTG